MIAVNNVWNQTLRSELLKQQFTITEPIWKRSHSESFKNNQVLAQIKDL